MSHIDPLQSGGPSLTTRTKAQARPVWSNESSEQFAGISDTVAQVLTIPALCTGMTVTSRDPTNATALYILPAGSGATGPRLVLDGGGSARRSHYMAFDPADPPPVHLLAEAVVGADADVFYHFD